MVALSNMDAPDQENAGTDGRKRKASVDSSPTSPKRLRHGEEDGVADERRRRESSASGHGPREIPSNTSFDRRHSATQEEKKRGKRLFGGLLNTLSQTNTNNAQQKRRHEIERRQHERIEKQRVEDDLRRSEKSSQLREARMARQSEFEEQVVSMIRSHGGKRKLNMV